MKSRFLVAACVRAVLIAYGEWQDSALQVRYTDVDYEVFTDASRLILEGSSPYKRHTYRYSPLLALILLPNVVLHRCFGKMVFSVCDLIIGWLVERILVIRGLSASQTHLFSAAWMFNPLTATVSSRGNAESILGVLVLLTIVLVMEQHVALAGVVFTLAVHFKLYPVIYMLTFYLFLDSNYTGQQTREQSIVSIVPNRVQWIFVLTVTATLTTITALFYAQYGSDFLQETYLYHFTRKDTRHNFSPYFYMFYLMSANVHETSSFTSHFGSVLVFLPQLVLLLVTSLLLHRDLTLCCFVQTFIFVSFNKVCTSQYFLWYLWLLPLILPYSKLQGRWTGAILVLLWFTVQGLWLMPAYLFEFQGIDTFIFMWTAGLVMFACNSVILIIVLRNHQYLPAFQYGKVCQYKV